MQRGLDPGVSPEEDLQKLTLFEILISVLESAFLLYESQESELREKQWRGWVDYLRIWARREDFRRAWPVLKGNFDRTFVHMMNDLVEAEKVRVGQNRVYPNGVADGAP